MWDPQQYLRHAAYRLRPLRDLLARVPDALPGHPRPRIADLGCGPGGPSEVLAQRWPGAHITGYDSSQDMLKEAEAHTRPGRLDFAYADLTDWRPDPDEHFGLLFANAALHWVPNHTDLLPEWIAALPPGGVLAFQVPGNFRAPTHTLLAELAESPRWQGRLGPPPRPDTVLDPAGYAEILAPLGPHGCDIDAWESTYLHRLTGPDPVLEWTKGTTLRPVLTRLKDDPAARHRFLSEYGQALRKAYPPAPDGTTAVPFRRVFMVAVKR
ncbi:methyltransferase domain-containing protein [Streptomyces albus subsp. chlorinus]|uniref:methyltransferase domain-containing protein n=1 Tax=Streptomyces albus TaxID=1888 RepID=UPI00156DA51B|nr:methyltransferase domain-containing protein [Streptomyces albus]NSC22170.1 methyltransferase domain-containing protein [Streptomyces albus subsp. chlorinus]